MDFLTNRSYGPLLRLWLDLLSNLFAKGYSELSEHRDRWYFEHPGFPIPDDWELPGFDYDTLGGNVTFEKNMGDHEELAGHTFVHCIAFL